MPTVERRSGNYRARHVDPTAKRHSKAFARKADAERFSREARIEAYRGSCAASFRSCSLKRQSISFRSLRLPKRPLSKHRNQPS